MNIIVLALVCNQCGKNEWVSTIDSVPKAQAAYNLEAMKEYECPVCWSRKWRLEILVREKGNGNGRIFGTSNP